MKFISTALYSIFILLLLGVAGLFLASLLPIPGNIQVKIVKSGSMEPAIHTGSIVIVRPATLYSEGDVVTFGADTGTQIPTTHRIVAIETGLLEDGGRVMYVTKGDANEEADTIRIAHDDVIGKVVLAIPFAGYILDFAKQPLGFTFMIGIPAGVIILDELARIVKEIRRMRRKDEVQVASDTDIDNSWYQNFGGLDSSGNHIRSMDGILPRRSQKYI